MSTRPIAGTVQSEGSSQISDSSPQIKDKYPYSSFITTLFFGAITVLGRAYLAFFSHTNSLCFLGCSIASFGAYLMIIGGLKCYLNRTLTPERKPQEQKIQHWIFKVVPPNWEAIKWYQLWKYPGWLFFGNDHDGPMGTERSSGERWIKKWGGKLDEKGKLVDVGEVSLRRFLAWQMRNPGHNLTFFGLGVAGWSNTPNYRILLIASHTIQLCGKSSKKTMHPMGNHSGIYIGLHPLPGFSFRVFIPGTQRVLEGYAGGRTRGQVGLSLRLKKKTKLK